MVFILLGSLTISTASPDKGKELSKADLLELDLIESAAKELSSHYDALKVNKGIAKTSAERKMIRHEMREMRREMQALEARAQALNGGTYIGGGALVVILLLLLLL